MSETEIVILASSMFICGMIYGVGIAWIAYKWGKRIGNNIVKDISND